MLKNVWAYMGNAFIQGLNAHEDDKATLKHMIVNTYVPTHRGRHIYLETLLAITKFKSNLKKNHHQASQTSHFSTRPRFQRQLFSHPLTSQLWAVTAWSQTMFTEYTELLQRKRCSTSPSAACFHLPCAPAWAAAFHTDSGNWRIAQESKRILFNSSPSLQGSCTNICKRTKAERDTFLWWQRQHPASSMPAAAATGACSPPWSSNPSTSPGTRLHGKKFHIPSSAAVTHGFLRGA